MASSIFLYELLPHTIHMASVIYQMLSTLPDDEESYFNLELLSEDELAGEFVIVHTVDEMYYDASARKFKQRQTQIARVVKFFVYNNHLEIWGNKSNANHLVFAISDTFHNQISINLVQTSIEDIIEKLCKYKIKVSRVCFQDFLFTEDIVGNFNVDLSSYSDAQGVLKKYKDKVARMTLLIPCAGQALKVNISSRGTVMVYKPKEAFDDTTLNILRSVMLN